MRPIGDDSHIPIPPSVASLRHLSGSPTNQAVRREQVRRGRYSIGGVNACVRHFEQTRPGKFLTLLVEISDRKISGKLSADRNPE